MTPSLHIANTLQISDTFTLPLEAVTETIAILAKRGVGKTFTASVIAEEMLKAGLHVVVLDPVGVWWGLRASADGEGKGLPIYVLGGQHADLPLEPHGGALVADLVVDKGLSVLLDLSEFKQEESRLFVTEFAERLYLRKARSRDPLHLILDEADAFAPQVPGPEERPMLSAIDRIVRRGRARGLGITLISQRPAVINKNVLTQTEVLITLQLTGPQDQKAVETWVSANGGEEQRKLLMASLASLPVGDAWVWSPSWLKVFERIHIRPRETFDSSATPKVGDVRREPHTFASVDLGALREQMAAMLEQAKANNPKALQAEIAALKARLAQAPVVAEPIVKRVEVPVLGEGQVQQMRAIVDALTATGKDMLSTAKEILARLPLAGTAPERAAYTTISHTIIKPLATEIPVVDKKASPQEAATVGAESKMALAERKVLTALAQYSQGRTKTQIALLTGYAVNGGGFGNTLSSLRSKGWMSGSQECLVITEAGKAALGTWVPLPTGKELLNYWCSHKLVGKAGRAILLELADAYPSALTKEVLAEKTGYASDGGGFGNSLSRLRTLELISRGVNIRLMDLLA